MSENSEIFVVVDNISKIFSGTQVLRDISTTISVGEVLGLIGRSGSGKSVLIHALRGSEEYRPTSGKIVYRVNHCEKCNRVDLPALGKNCTRCGGPTHIEEVDFWGLDERDPMRMAVKERIRSCSSVPSHCTGTCRSSRTSSRPSPPTSTRRPRYSGP